MRQKADDGQAVSVQEGRAGDGAEAVSQRAVGLPARAGPQPSHLSLLTAARGLSGIYTTAASCWTAIYPFSQLLEDYQVYTTAATCWTAIYPFSQLLEDHRPHQAAVEQPSTPSHSC